jgi:hypothetical protein
MIIKPATIAALFAVVLLTSQAHAVSLDCTKKGEEKKLTGASLASFHKKCEKDATSGVSDKCQKQADAKKLEGAARAAELKACLAKNKDG